MENSNNSPIPFACYESAMYRSERREKKLFVTIWLLIVLLVGTNLGWIWYESQFETVTTTSIEQENENGYNSYIGNDGDVFNGTAENYDHNHPEA